MCQDYFGVALKSYFAPFASRGTAQKAKGGGLGVTIWGNLPKRPDNPKDCSPDLMPGWSKHIEMHHQSDLICMSLCHILHSLFLCMICLFMTAVELVFLAACRNMSLGERFIILRPLLRSVLFMHCLHIAHIISKSYVILV